MDDISRTSPNDFLLERNVFSFYEGFDSGLLYHVDGLVQERRNSIAKAQCEKHGLRDSVDKDWGCRSGPCLNIKTVFPRYGDSHVKDKTVGETVLSLT